MSVSAREQYLLELINEARLDPLANAKRYITSFSKLTSPDADVQNALRGFDVDGALLKKRLGNLDSVAPVAWNAKLSAAALGHNDQMIAQDAQEHEGIGDGDPATRMSAHGYVFSTLGENIFAYASNPLHTHAAFMVDWGGPNGGMQDPPGHRDNIMAADFREVGLGITGEDSRRTQVGPEIVTQDFGTRQNSPAVFVLGVAYNDTDKDHFYSMGEGVKNLKVTLGGTSTFSATAGGYTLESSDTGRQTIAFSGGGLSGRVDAEVSLKEGMNVKFDVINGDTLHTSVSAKVSGPLSTIDGLGTQGLKLTAGSGRQTVFGTDGKDTLDGGSGKDRLHGGLGDDKLIGGSSSDTFAFDAKLGKSNVDAVTDFSVKQGDSFALEHDIFTKIGKGELGGGAYHEGSRAHDKSDRIIYDEAKGKLFYDADGKGAKDAVQFATLDKHLTLDHHDFLIV